MTNPYPITPRQLDLDKLSGSGLKKTGTYPNTQLSIEFSGSPINLSASTVNYQGVSSYSSPMDHTHGIEANSNPGANVSLLKTNPEGGITVQKLGVNLSGNPNYDLEVDSNLTFIGSQSIVTTSDSLTLSPASDLNLSPGGTARVKSTSGVRLQSDNYASQTTGWGINYAGSGDFRYLYADELHAKTFIADLEQALAGGQIISKSVAPLAVNFTAPAAKANATLIVESFKGFDTFKVFVDGDIVCVREFDRSGTSLSISNCWGTVVWVSTDTVNKTQTYTFTRSAAPNAGEMIATTVIAAGAMVLDFGTTGNGYLESNAIDGAMAEYAPYHQIVSWATHPATGETVRTRLGNLKGIFNTANEYGLYAGAGITDASQFLRISNEAVEAHNLPIKMYDGASVTMQLSPTAPSFAMGSTLPSNYSTGDGLWMGKDTLYKFRVGDVDGELLAWDGSDLYVKSNAYNYVKFTGTSMQFYSGVSSATKVMEFTNTPAITIGQVASSQNNIYITGGALSIRNNTTERIGMTAAGILTIKDSAGNAVFTFNASSGAEFTKPLTLSTTGGIYQGTGSFASPTTGLKIWNDSGVGRIAGYNATTIQWYAGTDGIFYAGAGALTLGAAGFRFFGTGAAGSSRTITWYDTSAGEKLTGYLYSDYGGGGGVATSMLLSVKNTGDPWSYPLTSVIATDNTASLDVRLVVGATDGGIIYATHKIWGAGNIRTDGNFISYKNSTEYTGYIFVPLTTPLTSTSWDGDSFSDVSTSTLIDTSAVFGVPAGVKAILFWIQAKDSASWGTGGLYFALGPTSTYWYAGGVDTYGGDVNSSVLQVIPTNANGDVYYRINASGTNTMDISIRVWGYWI
jgi:hypothetical protein